MVPEDIQLEPGLRASYSPPASSAQSLPHFIRQRVGLTVAVGVINHSQPRANGLRAKTHRYADQRQKNIRNALGGTPSLRSTFVQGRLSIKAYNMVKKHRCIECLSK